MEIVMVTILNKLYGLVRLVRGWITRKFFLRRSCGYALRVDSGFRFRGYLKVGDGVSIGRNVRMYSNNTIGDDCIIGDNVELRSNGPSKIVIGNKVSVNRNTTIIGVVKIGNNCAIAPNCVIVGSNHVFSSTETTIVEQGLERKGISIGDDVWVGAGAMILDGVAVGDGVVIGAGSVVTKNIPSFSIAVGNPCRVVKSRK